MDVMNEPVFARFGFNMRVLKGFPTLHQAPDFLCNVVNFMFTSVQFVAGSRPRVWAPISRSGNQCFFVGFCVSSGSVIIVRHIIRLTKCVLQEQSINFIRWNREILIKRYKIKLCPSPGRLRSKTKQVSLKSKSCHDDSFNVTWDTTDCHDDNPRWHQWRQLLVFSF